MRHASAALARTAWKAVMRADTSMTRRMVAGFGYAPNFSRLQRDAFTRLAFQPMVLPRGNAPRSIDYRSMALLLSYGREMVPAPGDAPGFSG